MCVLMLRWPITSVRYRDNILFRIVVRRRKEGNNNNNNNHLFVLTIYKEIITINIKLV